MVVHYAEAELPKDVTPHIAYADEVVDVISYERGE